MKCWSVVFIGTFGLLGIASTSTQACAICNGLTFQNSTLRQDAAQAKLILFGSLVNARLQANNNGVTDLEIQKVLKNDPFLGNKKVIELPRYVPGDAKNPPKFLVFCDVYKDANQQTKVDPFRGIPVKSSAIVDYLQGVVALDPKDRTKTLLYCFDFLDNRDPEVANDAFQEFAKATDQEIGHVADRLSAAKLHAWLDDSDTPVQRLGLYALLLGACGGDKDAAFLRSMLEKPTKRTANAIDGMLCGYIRLRPRQGWDLAQAILADVRRPFPQRYAVMNTLRFYHGWKPEETKADILPCVEVAVAQGDIADVAIEDLRRWQMWDLTRTVLAQYDKKSHDAPIVHRTIVRYALSCPKPDAARFVAERRKQEPDLVNEVEESLRFEKPK